MTLVIPYESENFQPGSLVNNGTDRLVTSWDELLWAAITVGRPNRHYVFRHGSASLYEAVFRLSLIRMALEQHGRRGMRLHRTEAARTLDPSEKGAVNYFLGLAICKLFADKLLHAPWLLHLDVFRPLLTPILTGRSRPDLVGETASGEWVALECKGRISVPNAVTKDKAKLQAQRLVSVNGVSPAFQIGGVAYFRNDVLHFYWRDPEPDPKVGKPIRVSVESEMWMHYYTPVLDLIRSDPDSFERMQHEPLLVPVKSADIQVGIYPAVLRALVESQWGEARDLARKEEIVATNLPYQADGIAVVAGDSWFMPFKEFGG